MKREIAAALLLAALFGVSLWGVRRTDRLVDEIEQHLALSEKALRADDRASAETELEAALRVWRAAEGYTHVFLRHPEIDSVSDAFFALRQGLRAGDGVELGAAYDLLRYHLECIDSMEHISPGSVF
jgi:hypothetical protein